MISRAKLYLSVASASIRSTDCWHKKPVAVYEQSTSVSSMFDCESMTVAIASAWYGMIMVEYLFTAPPRLPEEKTVNIKITNEKCGGRGGMRGVEDGRCRTVKKRRGVRRGAASDCT